MAHNLSEGQLRRRILEIDPDYYRREGGRAEQDVVHAGSASTPSVNTFATGERKDEAA